MINNLPMQVNTKQFLEFSSKTFKVKQYFQNFIFSNDEFKENLVQFISQSIELFSYNYTPSSLSLKIKKTTLKKDPDYRHESIYYYNIINQALYQAIYPFLPNITDPDILDLVSNQYNLQLLYSITSLNDNIINIYF